MKIEFTDMQKDVDEKCQFLEFLQQSVSMIGQGMTKQHDERPEEKRVTH